MSMANMLARAGAAAQQGARRSRLWSLVATWPLAIASWTDTGTPGETTGVGDPFGGTDAVTTGDDDAAGYESHLYQSASALVIGAQYRFVHWIEKDAVTDRFPEIQHIAGTGFAHCQINTQTGATVIRGSANWTGLSLSAVTAPEDAGWWRMTLVFTPVATNAPRIAVLPAASSTLGGATTAAETGSLTWYPGIRLEQKA